MDIFRMDLLRLGLERGKTAFSALQVIINLLEEFGQGGNCGLHTSTYYNNAYELLDFNDFNCFVIINLVI